MSPTAAISLGIGIIALGALTAIGIIATLNTASRRLEHVIADALDHDHDHDWPDDLNDDGTDHINHQWLDSIDDEYQALLEENA